jgi:hypothetical protein
MSKDFFEALKVDFARKTLWEIVKWTAIAIAVAVWSYAGTDFGASKIPVLQLWRFPLAVTAVAVSVWIVAYVYHARHKFTPSFDKMEFDFLIKEKRVTYKRAASGEIDYRKWCRLKALKSGLDTYRDKYHWTGTDGSEPCANIRGQQVYTTIRKNVWQFYEVRLQKTLDKGEEIDVEVVWSLDDKDRVAVPFISATVEEPTEKLVLSVELPKDLSITEVVYERASGIGARKPIKSEILKLDADGRVSHPVPSPQLLHHYEIRWIY